MNKAKDIFDTRLVRARRARGQKHAIDPFLLHRCADDAAQRILDINRTFSRTLIFANPEISKRIVQIVQEAGDKEAGDKLEHVVCVDHSDAVDGLDLVCAETGLAFMSGSFDLVINALSLHGVNHVPQALGEMKRLLKPDGLLIAALFGGETLGALRHALYETEDTLYGRVSPRVSPMVSLQQAAKLLQTAGFAMPVTDRDVVQIHYSNLASLYADLRRMGETNTLNGRARRPVSKRFFQKLEQIYARDHGDASGKFIVKFELVWMTGWTPHKDQPKPLKPGSAKTRLADALGVKEQKL
ncbi:MAG: SAM-dependent methyltransferase [Robiginitomaculum sp.]|nr:MAG: SAM-dependent methyltransferase [Robiginitomaculum sp.]